MRATRLADFDTWRPGYGSAVVDVFKAGTTNPATIYADENLVTALANPQTLLSLVLDGVDHGKWAQTVYTAEAVELRINSADLTGIIRPGMTELTGEDATEATVEVGGATETREIGDILNRAFWVQDFGEWREIGSVGSSASTNNTTLVDAIGAAAGQGGGTVLIPAGSYAITQVNIPANVKVRGEGRGVTILQSQVGDDIVTIGGDRAGLAGLTLDGVNLVPGSVGVFSKANDQIEFDDVVVKRFETGVFLKGGKDCFWPSLFVENCATGAKLHGDSDSGGGGNGDVVQNLRWRAGQVATCTVAGVEIKNVDRVPSQIDISAAIINNAGTGILNIGGRFVSLTECRMTGNTVNIDIQDPSSPTSENETIGFHMFGGEISGGEIKFSGNCQNVIFERVNLDGVTVTPTLPTNQIIALDCRESSSVIIAGTAIKWGRWSSLQRASAQGVTTSATPVKAWGIQLEPGQVIYAEAKVIGVRQDGTQTGEYHFSISAKRPGATLTYDTQTANFAAGKIVTGQTSGATGLIINDADAGATGTLTLRKIAEGPGGALFQDNEVLKDSATGQALANGTLSYSNVSLLGSQTEIRAVREDTAGWAAAFAANGPELELQVTGAASNTIDWYVDVEWTLGG